MTERLGDAPIDYEYAHGVACVELAKAKAEIERLLKSEESLRLAVAALVKNETELRAEIERWRGLLDDKQYIQTKADYNRGHLSHTGWLESRERAALRPKP